MRIMVVTEYDVTIPVTYGELPDSAGKTYIECQSAGCYECGIPYASSRGDYWMFHKSETVECGTCGMPMALVKPVAQ